MEKKSASLASRSAVIAAAGISIITPTGRSGSKCTRSRRSSSLTCSRIVHARRYSVTDEIIGSISLTRPSADARRMARSCVRKSSGRAKL